LWIPTFTSKIYRYGVISFDKGKEIIRKGEEATFAVYEQLKK
jgi:NTE family protein